MCRSFCVKKIISTRSFRSGCEPAFGRTMSSRPPHRACTHRTRQRHIDRLSGRGMPQHVLAEVTERTMESVLERGERRGGIRIMFPAGRCILPLRTRRKAPQRFPPSSTRASATARSTSAPRPSARAGRCRGVLRSSTLARIDDGVPQVLSAEGGQRLAVRWMRLRVQSGLRGRAIIAESTAQVAPHRTLDHGARQSGGRRWHRVPGPEWLDLHLRAAPARRHRLHWKRCPPDLGRA